ncbi:jg14987 [Pararge aegeria aegeria]|uniref:Jg14987 protein n=1 Tax=Pararge aegeria aegeria TaxID=348720 RepID=A0A8S4QWF9_9NEOP|nr:jg14987 [Pararge aegeria aegeria]
MYSTDLKSQELIQRRRASGASVKICQKLSPRALRYRSGEGEDVIPPMRLGLWLSLTYGQYRLMD